MVSKTGDSVKAPAALDRSLTPALLGVV